MRPKRNWRRRKVSKEVRIKICTFGKTLDINDIIESVSYEKGDKNDIGDAPEDYVVIKLRNDTKTKAAIH